MYAPPTDSLSFLEPSSSSSLFWRSGWYSHGFTIRCESCSSSHDSFCLKFWHHHLCCSDRKMYVNFCSIFWSMPNQGKSLCATYIAKCISGSAAINPTKQSLISTVLQVLVLREMGCPECLVIFLYGHTSANSRDPVKKKSIVDTGQSSFSEFRQN